MGAQHSQEEVDAPEPFFIVVTGNVGCHASPFLNALRARFSATLYGSTNDVVKRLGREHDAINLLERFSQSKENPFALQVASFNARLKLLQSIYREPPSRIIILYRSPWDEVLGFLPALVDLGALKACENYTLQHMYGIMQPSLRLLLKPERTLYVYLKVPLEHCVERAGSDSGYWNETTLRSLERTLDRWLLSSDFKSLYRVSCVSAREWPPSARELDSMVSHVYADLLPPSQAQLYRARLAEESEESGDDRKLDSDHEK